MLKDVLSVICSETKIGSNISVFRRNLQRAYLCAMLKLMIEDLDPNRRRQYYNVSQYDLRALVIGELNVIKRMLASVVRTNINMETKYDYRDGIERINLILDPK